MSDTRKTTKPNVPNLRFPGFEGEWENKRIGDIGKFFSGGTPSSSRKDFYGGEIPFIRSGEIHSDKTELFLTQEGYKNSSAKMVEVGDILLALYGANSGDISISQMRGAINQAILCIRTNVAPVFFKSVWEKLAQKILNTYLQGGQGNLSADIVKKITISIPSQIEQAKIAALFSHLDERISIQNRLIEDLKKLRCAIIENVFCSPNHNESALRFKGNTDPLSTYRMEDFCSRITRKNKDNQCSLVLTIAAQYGLVDQESFFNKTVASENLAGYYLLHKGEFAYNRSYSAGYDWGAVKRLEKYPEGVLSTLYICFKIDESAVDSDYLAYYFESTKWHKGLSDIAGEGARNHGLLNVSVNDYFNTRHRFHCMREQKIIASMLNVISQKENDEIALYDNYQKQKQYLLRKMFI